MFFKKILPLFVVVLLTIGITGCSEKGEAQEVAAIVNGEDIYVSDYNASLEDSKEIYQQQGIDLESEEGQQLLKMLEQQTLDNMLSEKILEQEIAKKNYKVSEQDVNREMEEIKKVFPSAEHFEQALEESNITESELKDMITKEHKTKQYINEKAGEITVTEEELEEQYKLYSEQVQDALSLEEIRLQLEQQIEQQKMQQELGVIIEELRNSSSIEIFLFD